MSVWCRFFWLFFWGWGGEGVGKGVNSLQMRWNLAFIYVYRSIYFSGSGLFLSGDFLLFRSLGYLFIYFVFIHFLIDSIGGKRVSFGEPFTPVPILISSGCFSFRSIYLSYSYIFFIHLFIVWVTWRSQWLIRHFLGLVAGIGLEIILSASNLAFFLPLFSFFFFFPRFAYSWSILGE